MIRLAILGSHPIQYNAPLFRLLSKRSDIKVRVFYCWEGTANQVDPEFGEKIIWDIPLLDGYDYTIVPNVSRTPGTHHFRGIDNPDMISKIEQWQADAVLVYGWSFRTNLAVLKYFHGRIPVFFRGDSTLLTGGNPLRQVLRRYCLKYVYRHIDVALYPGERSRNYFINSGLSPAQLKWVPHSIDNHRFSDQAEAYELQAQQYKVKLGIPKDATVLLFAGKLVPWKEPELLLQAVLELLTETGFESLHLVFAGTGALYERLQDLASNSQHVHFLGFQNQSIMPMVYRIGNVFVLPSLMETWGLSVNEAMACGRAVIVSNRVGCAPDLIEDGVTGDVFLSGNIFELKRVISAYMDEPGRAMRLGDAGLLKIDEWSVDEATEKMGKHIAHVCSKRSRG